jgi:hypothetical protein
MPMLRQAATLRVDVRALSGACSFGRVHVKGADNVHRSGRAAGPGLLFLTHGAWQLSEAKTGCLFAMKADAMSGMITRVRPPRRDEMNVYCRALPPGDPDTSQPDGHTGDANS